LRVKNGGISEVKKAIKDRRMRRSTEKENGVLDIL